MEEEYAELQLRESYYRQFNTIIAPHFNMDKNGLFSDVAVPLKISESEKKILIVDLWKIQVNRVFVLKYYSEVEANIRKLLSAIEKQLRN